MAEPADAERATGYLVGGISPIATTRRMRVVLDLPAASLERVYVSAGRRGLQVSLRPDDLLAAIGAEARPAGRGSSPAGGVPSGA